MPSNTPSWGRGITWTEINSPTSRHAAAPASTAARTLPTSPRTTAVTNPPPISQAFGDLPRAAETFEQKNGFGKFVLHAGDDVLPGDGGNFVAGVATETVHAAPAPDQQRVGDEVPKFYVVLFEFDQILPDRACRAGAGEFAVQLF